MSKESKEINFSLDRSSDRLGSQKRYFIASIPSDKYILIVNAKTTFTGELPNTEILIFDYSGKAIAKYELDRFVYSYAMDWENFRLFCYDDFEDVFLSYDFWELEK